MYRQSSFVVWNKSFGADTTHGFETMSGQLSCLADIRSTAFSKGVCGDISRDDSLLTKDLFNPETPSLSLLIHSR